MSAQPYPITATRDEAPEASTLSSRRGVAILLLLSVVQFMDILDASILNIALPSIKTDLGFSQQSLQWVVNGYILTYGGFLLLGGRMADLLGRRSVRPGRLRRLVVDRRSCPHQFAARRRPLCPGSRGSHDVSGRPLHADEHVSQHT